MSIMLGNLSIKQIEERLDVEFPDELKTIMRQCHQENVSVPIAEDHWHCFDLPFMIVCGNTNKLPKIIYKHLSPLADKMKTQLRINISKEK